MMSRIAPPSVSSAPSTPRFAAKQRAQDSSSSPETQTVLSRRNFNTGFGLTLLGIMTGACRLGQQDLIPAVSNNQPVDLIGAGEINELLNRIPNLAQIAQQAYANNYELWEAGFAFNPKDRNNPFFYFITTPADSLQDGKFIKSLNVLSPDVLAWQKDPLKAPPRVFYGPLNDIRQLTVTDIGTCRCPGPITIRTQENMTLSLQPYPYLDGERLIYPEDATGESRSLVFSYVKPQKYQRTSR